MICNSYVEIGTRMRPKFHIYVARHSRLVWEKGYKENVTDLCLHYLELGTITQRKVIFVWLMTRTYLLNPNMYCDLSSVPHSLGLLYLQRQIQLQLMKKKSSLVTQTIKKLSFNHLHFWNDHFMKLRKHNINFLYET